MPHRTWLLFVLLLSTFSPSQQPNTPSAPAGTPQSSSDRIPPDTKAPPPQSHAPDQRVGSTNTEPREPQGISSGEVRRRIVKELHADSGLAGSNIHVRVTSKSVVLSGSVPTLPNRLAARRIAETNAGTRKVVNRLTARQSE
jgi:hypothetical protein